MKKTFAMSASSALALMALVVPAARAESSGKSGAVCPPANATASPFCDADSSSVCSELVSQGGKPPAKSLPAGFTAMPKVSISSLGSKIVQGLGKGGLCCGVVAVAGQDVTLYRAWAPHYDAQSTPPPGYAPSWQFGNWWSSEQPDTVSRSVYRKEEDICVSWDSLTVYSKCTLPKGTQVVIGPGQSACCDSGVYLLESSVLQIYVPNHGTGTQSRFQDCETFVWPGSQ